MFGPTKPSKPLGAKKFFHTLYNVVIRLSGASVEVFLYRWNPYEEKAEYLRKHSCGVGDLKKFRPYKDNLIKKGGIWIKDKTLDKFCKRFGWPFMKHFEGCQKCNDFRYIPLMSFYTGCPVCNKSDQGEYTHFEANKRAQNL